jgi:cytidylate kinase
MKPPLIAIDGPAGAGKSTTAMEVARRLGLPYLDTGALYRAAAWCFVQAGVNLKQPAAVQKQIEKCRLHFHEGEAGTHVWMDDREITSHLRSQELTMKVGPVCELSEVRRWLVDLQRRWALRGFGVMEGRDIGTIVLPQAELKIFLTAKPEIRAERRARQLGIADDRAAVEKLAREIAERDKRDAERDIAPLRPARDAIEIDTSTLTFQEQVSKVVRLAGERFDFKIYG